MKKEKEEEEEEAREKTDDKLRRDYHRVMASRLEYVAYLLISRTPISST